MSDLKRWTKALVVVVSALVIVLALTGCEDVTYDTKVGKCVVSDEQAEIGIYEYIDRDQTDRRLASALMLKLCATLEESTK